MSMVSELSFLLKLQVSHFERKTVSQSLRITVDAQVICYRDARVVAELTHE